MDYDTDDDDCSNCTEVGSVDELNPNTLDPTTGDFSAINNQLFSVLAYNINSITATSKRCS